MARFTGLAGELPVRVTGHGSGGTLEVTTTAGQLPALPAAAQWATRGSAARGDEALVAIRPTGIQLARTDADERHLSGLVADVAFRGRGYEYAIDLPGLGRLTGVFARHRAERGEEVGIRLDPEGCHVFPADQAAAPAPPAALTAAAPAGA